MMYDYMLEECISRAEKEIAIYRKLHRQEEIAHVQRRIDSLKRLRKYAKKSVNPPQRAYPTGEKPSLKDILADIRGFYP